MELFIYDREMNLQGAMDIFDSLRWRRRYFQPGEFELHCKPTAQNIELLLSENMLARRDAAEAGVIENIEITDDVLIVKGRFLSSYLGRRIVWNTTTIRNTAENAMRQLVNENCIASRPIPRLMLGGVIGFEDFLDIQVSYRNLLDTLTNISRVSNIGYIVRPDFIQRKLFFETYKGMNRSIEQNGNPWAIFSDEFENVTEDKYTLSCESFKNVALIGGEGEGTARTLICIGSSEGLDRYETFVDARSMQKDETMAQEQYEALLTQYGLTELSGFVVAESFESKVNTNSNLRYKQDFNLGDIVTCIKKSWGKVVNVRITEIEEIYENGVTSIIPTFGSPLPELPDILKE